MPPVSRRFPTSSSSRWSASRWCCSSPSDPPTRRATSCRRAASRSRSRCSARPRGWRHSEWDGGCRRAAAAGADRSGTGARRTAATDGCRFAAHIGLVVLGICLLGLSIVATDPPVGVCSGVLGLGCLVIAEDPPRRAAVLPPLAMVLVVLPVAAYVRLSAMGAVAVASALGIAYLAAAAVADRTSWWSLPLVGFAASVGVASSGGGTARLASSASAVALGVVLATPWGPMPWSSRVLGRIGAMRGGSHETARGGTGDRRCVCSCDGGGHVGGRSPMTFCWARSGSWSSVS